MAEAIREREERSGPTIKLEKWYKRQHAQTRVDCFTDEYYQVLPGTTTTRTSET